MLLQRRVIVLGVVYLHVLLLSVALLSFWSHLYSDTVTTMVLSGITISAVVATIYPDRRVTATCAAIVTLITAIILMESTGGMRQAYIYAFFLLALLSLYHLRWLLAVSAGILSVMFLLATEDNWAAALDVSLIFSVVILKFIHWRITEEMRLEYEEISQAFSTASGLAKFGHDRVAIAEKAQEAFFGAMVHQLKTPLTVVRGYIEMLLDYWGDLPEERKIVLVGKMLEGATTMNHTIEKNLDIIKNDIEGWKTENVWIENLGEKIAYIVENLSVKYNVEFWEQPIVSRVQIDEGVLSVILEHLVENASCHGDKDRPVSVVLEEAHDGVRICVENWGSTEFPRIGEACFERGNRGKNSSGSGLGLWIVKNYTQSLGGEIFVQQVDSNEQRKTTFTLVLPAEKPPTEERELRDIRRFDTARR